MSATSAATGDPFVRRRVFASWSIAVPKALEETFVEEGGYLHLYAEDRTVSMTSVELTDRGQPVLADRILDRMPPPEEGTRLDVLPPGLSGWAITRPAIPPACAGQMLQGLLVTDGRIAIVTITCDDAAWAATVWQSIRAVRHRPCQPGVCHPPQAARRRDS